MRQKKLKEGYVRYTYKCKGCGSKSTIDVHEDYMFTPNECCPDFLSGYTDWEITRQEYQPPNPKKRAR